ncbi:MAG: hypothetical protein JWO74_3444 [Solirubrobacterales bacterium]|nr:hypothetical protein [Solirubrobacterales bacterium]
MDLSAILVIAGLAFMAAGLLFLIFAPKPQELATAQGAVEDTAELIKQIGTFLDKFEARFRVGLAVMFFGLALVGAGVFLEAKDAKDAAKTAPAAALLP